MLVVRVLVLMLMLVLVGVVRMRVGVAVVRLVRLRLWGVSAVMVVMHLHEIITSGIYRAGEWGSGRQGLRQQIVLGGGIEGLEVVQLLVVCQRWWRRQR